MHKCKKSKFAKRGTDYTKTRPKGNRIFLKSQSLSSKLPQNLAFNIVGKYILSFLSSKDTLPPAGTVLGRPGTERSGMRFLSLQQKNRRRKQDKYSWEPESIIQSVGQMLGLSVWQSIGGPAKQSASQSYNQKLASKRISYRGDGGVGGGVGG